MTKEDFDNKVLLCKTCGQKPVLEGVTSLFDVTRTNVKYRVICPECAWEDGQLGNKTGLCKTPEGALKAWNKRYGIK